MVIKEFGSIAQGLREISRLVPDRLRTFLARAATRVFGAAAEMHMDGDPAIEIRGALLGAMEVEPGTSAAPEARTRERAPRGAEVQAVPPPAEEASSLPSALVTAVTDRAGSRADARLVTYLLASHAVLTLAIIAAAVVLLIELSL